MQLKNRNQHDFNGIEKLILNPLWHSLIKTSSNNISSPGNKHMTQVNNITNKAI